MANEETMQHMRRLAIARLLMPLHTALQVLDAFIWAPEGSKTEISLDLLGAEAGQAVLLLNDMRKLMTDLFPKATPPSMKPADVVCSINPDGTVTVSKVVQPIAAAVVQPSEQSADSAVVGGPAIATPPTST